MSKLDTIIDFGSQNLRLGVFNQSSQIIYSSNIKITETLDNENSEKFLNKLIRDAEKKLSTHLIDVNILYDSSEFSFIDLSIKKTFDQPTLISKFYNSLVEEANFIISENNFLNQVIHININNVIVDDKKKLEIEFDDIKIKSLILELKFICLKKSLINNLSNKFKKNNLKILNIYCSSYVKSIFYKKKYQRRNNLIFLDVGYERTTALFFRNNKFKTFKSISLGGNNITKDISKVLNLDLVYAEELKLKFHKVKIDLPINKNISVELLKKVVQARVEEIIELAINFENYFQKLNIFEKPSIILIGNGLKLISSSNNIKIKNNYSELIFFEENDSKICEAGFYYYKNDESLLTHLKKKSRKVGFFESFFNLFSK